MVFSSFTFLIYFLPAFLLIYFLAPSAWKNVVLFAGSLLFYYYGVREHPVYVLLILMTAGVNYVLALDIEKCRNQTERKLRLIMGMTWNLGWLFLFKTMVLPIGISFYTFQISSYLIDVYRDKIPAERSMLKLGTYLCMFPKLAAGPIVTYSELKDQLQKRVHSFRNLEEGLREFTIGLALKVLIANRVGGLWNQVQAIGFESISTPMAWLGIVAYSFQIYFDFYGYSLMAKGLGQIMGFQFPDNFRDPYLSRSMTDFWRRWHMTLGSWFREYVYIPLGGNRSHLYRNLFIVWMLTGLWHGAGWNYLLWGLFIFILLVLEKCGLKKWLDEKPLLGHLYMLLAIPFSWLLFAVTDVGQIGVYLGRLLPFLGEAKAAIYAGDFVKYGKDCFWALLAALLCCTGIPRKIYEQKKYTLVVTLLLVVLFWACIYCMYMGMDDPFLYYQF